MELRQWQLRFKAATSGWILFYPSGSGKSCGMQRGLLKLLLQEGWTMEICYPQNVYWLRLNYPAADIPFYPRHY